MRWVTACRLLTAALLVGCTAARHAVRAANSTAQQQDLEQHVLRQQEQHQRVLEAAETGTVPLDALLRAIASSPQLADTRNAPPSLARRKYTQFGPFGQLLDLPGDAPSDEALLEHSEPLTPQDFERAQFMPLLPLPLGTADMLASERHFEGDIIITPDDFTTINEDSESITPHKLWPGGVLHYALSPQFSAQERAVIARAVMEFERHTCLKVRPMPPGGAGGQHFVHVVKGAGCYSGVGRMESKHSRSQELSLGDNCIFPGVVMHEFMHAFGFWHEQSRPDRDEHVYVHTENIRREMLVNFKKYDWDTVATRAEPYDVGSIMHYGPSAFAVDPRRPTLSALKDLRTEMGQRRAFSKIDIRKLNRLYGCDDKSVPPTVLPPPPPEEGDEEDEDKENCRDDSQYCPYWARRGECMKNEGYMHKHCRRSCKKCIDGTCEDLHRLCEGWEEKKQCRENPSYMLVYCRRACKVCSERHACQDMHRLCDFWARTDECDRNPDFMAMYCKSSCNVC